VKNDLSVCAVISRNGVPIAWDGLDDGNKETFATLTATVLGATEVIYSSMGLSLPISVSSVSEDGNLAMMGLNKKSMIAVMGNKDPAELNEVIQEAVTRVKEVFENER
jgi:predicted regulator of Ras-like GTPase activity (Roadblock/LC7/MglB family)